MVQVTPTPIPRTLALTLYGDLDVSVIRELPPGRLPVKTIAKPEGRRDEVYAFTRSQIDAGRQAYVSYPLVEESDTVASRAATEEVERLKQQEFPDLADRIELLTWRLRQRGLRPRTGLQPRST